jgi:putative flippase GtrA
MKLHVQLSRYVVVGLISNAIGYLLYLLLTTLGLGHKTSMTLLYVIGTLQTFVFNKRWTFTHHGGTRQSLLRYLMAYGGCYILNLALLYFLVDQIRLPHLLVQGIAILGIALLLFFLQRYWVFAPFQSQLQKDQAPI